jgi:signal peptidase II
MARTFSSQPSLLRRLAPWLLLAALIIGLDQATKLTAEYLLGYGQRVPVIAGFLDWTLFYNPGAAFSFLAEAGGWQRWLFTALGIGASIWIISMLAQYGSQRLFCLSLTLIMGGALGNVIDRLLHGHVIDFILVHYGNWYFPAFNLADSAITVGAIMMVLDELRRVRKSRER